MTFQFRKLTQTAFVFAEAPEDRIPWAGLHKAEVVAVHPILAGHLSPFPHAGRRPSNTLSLWELAGKWDTEAAADVAADEALCVWALEALHNLAAPFLVEQSGRI